MLSTSFSAAVWTAIVAPLAWAAMLLTLYRGSRAERSAVCPQRAARQAALRAAAPTTAAPSAAGLPRQAVGSREVLSGR